MNINLSGITTLIIKHLDGELTTDEQAELDQWLATSEKERALFSKLTDSAYVQKELEKFYAYNADAGWEKIQNAYPAHQKIVDMPRSFRWKYWVAAAIFLIVAGGGVFFLYYPQKADQGLVLDNISATQSAIPAPLTSKATITLAGGRKLTLDSIADGAVALDGNITIRKTLDGQILYDTENEQPGADIQFNTLNNPRGSKVIQLILHDGTRVWLNAESSIRYPAAFAAGRREVEVSGEAYFEVAKNAAKPFYVKANNTSVQVTGTHFNVNAYANETSVKVTLLEGAVKVVKGDAFAMLEPGQQAQVTDHVKVNPQVDTEEVMAWKNGQFSFKGTDIYTIMRQLSRWYDVEVHFKDAVTEQFYGDISRNTNALDVLHMLEITGSIHFKTNGNSIEVSK